MRRSFWGQKIARERKLLRAKNLWREIYSGRTVAEGAFMRT